MSEEEIIEGNKLIAEFMGLKYYLDYGYFHDTYFSQAVEMSEEIYTPIYHSSWDWLMPVINKICKDNKLYYRNSSGEEFDIMYYRFEFRNSDEKVMAWTPQYNESDILAAFIAVIRFIKYITNK